MSLKTASFLFGTVAIIGLMAGCASKPQFTAQQETSSYLARARGSYTPPGPASDPWGPYIREASAKYDVPDKWIREVMRQESGGHLFNRGGDLITSGAGAMGLMQVMPATYDDLRSRYRELGDDPYDPHNNILAGAAYLREMYDIYGSPGFLAAYNAGPGRLDDYLTRNRTLPTETRRYVASIGPRIAGYEPSRASPGATYAMNSLPLNIQSGPRYPQYDTQFASTVPVPAEPARPIVLNPPVLSAPVEVAEAPRPVITLAPPAPVAVARAEAPTPYIKLNPPAPAPVMVAEAEPPAQPFRISRPEPAYVEPEADPVRSVLGAARRANAARMARDLPLPEPPPPPPVSNQFARRSLGASRPIEVAEFPEPPRPPSARAAAASELVALGPHSRGFGLISSANAAPSRAVPIVTAKGGAWAVQVGAFANQNIARSATAAARDHARDVLGSAQTVVAGVRQPGGLLYRARLGGLSQAEASQACERLSRARTNCMVVSPEAQR